MLTKKITILNPSGLHARPAGNFVKTAGKFNSAVTFAKNGRCFDGKSIISVLSACVKLHDEIELRIEGSDEEAACSAITDAVNSGLGEQIRE